MRGIAIAGMGAAAVIVVVGIALLRDPPPIDSPADAGRAAEELRDERAVESATARTASPSPADRATVVTSPAGFAEHDPTDALREYRGTGAITLKVVDAADATPLPDLPFAVYSERPTIHVFTRGVTDERGEATIPALPEDVVIFETPRRPPHANTVLATWLKRGEQKSIVMRVGHGGLVRGRVVDDRGMPLEGVEVRIDPRPGPWGVAEGTSVQAVEPGVAARFAESTALLARNDGSGRFEVSALLARPAAIWVERGAMAPKREEKLWLQFWSGAERASVQVAPHEGETIELGDVVVERERVYAGRVLFWDGSPAAGCLISSRFERLARLGQRAFELPWFEAGPLRADGAREGSTCNFELAPWEPGFVLAAGEAVTRGDGSFEVAVAWPAIHTIECPDGTRSALPLPSAPPGSRTEGLEFRLPQQTQLLLELTEADGTPLPLKFDDEWLQVGATAIARDGAEHVVYVHRGSPTLFGAIVDLPPAQFARLVVQASGREIATHDFASPPIGRPRIALTLTRKESFELAFRVSFADEREREAWNGVFLRLLARPQPRAAAGSDAVAHRSFRPKEQPDVTLSVPSRRAWFVSAVGPFLEDGRGDGEVALGRFAPDGDVHEVELPRVSEAFLARRARKEQEAGSGEQARSPSGSCTFQLIDAETDAEIEPARVELARIDGASSGPAPAIWRDSTARRDGRDVALLVASPGSHTLCVRKRGYRDSAPIAVTIDADEKRDGGRIVLEPLPAHRVRLLRHDGSPAAWWHVEVVDPATALEQMKSFRGFEFASSADGIATLRCELPDSVLLVAFPPDVYGASDPGATMPVRFSATPWPGDETRAFELPPLRTLAVVVDLQAIDADLRSGACELSMRVAEGSLVERSWWCKARSASDPVEAGRRFLFTAAPGRYVVRLRAAFATAPELEVELADVAEPQEFTLVAQPR